MSAVSQDRVARVLAIQRLQDAINNILADEMNKARQNIRIALSDLAHEDE